MTDEAMIQANLDAVNSLIELLGKCQNDRHVVSAEQVQVFKRSVIQLLDCVRSTLSRLRILPYFRVSLKFYSKVFAIEKPESPLLNEESKFQKPQCIKNVTGLTIDDHL